MFVPDVSGAQRLTLGDDERVAFTERADVEEGEAVTRCSRRVKGPSAPLWESASLPVYPRAYRLSVSTSLNDGMSPAMICTFPGSYGQPRFQQLQRALVKGEGD